MADRHDSTLMPAPHGPVTRAIRAVRTEPEPPRRAFLRALAAISASGAVLGLSDAHSAEPDSADEAEAFLAEASTLGLFFTVDRDGELWRSTRIRGRLTEIEARDRLAERLQSRPRLKTAVRAAVLRESRV